MVASLGLAHITGRPTFEDKFMRLRTLLIAAAAVVASVSAASAALPEGGIPIAYHGHGYVVARNAASRLIVMTPTAPAGRLVQGDALAYGTIAGSGAKFRSGILLVHAKPLDACANGRYAILDMERAESRLLDVGCTKGTRVRLSGTKDKPVAVETLHGKVVRRIALR